MCITEVWSFRECGCFYNHGVLCRDFQQQRSPCVALSIQYPLDRWLHDTGVNGEEASTPSLRQSRSPEYQNCPNHRTVQRSFLNQICDDCLLAELESTSHHPESETSTHRVLGGTLGNGEGLIWDSEVNIKIESPVSNSPTNLLSQDKHQLPQICMDEDKRVFDSHVEITIEPDDHSYSSPDFCPSAFVTPQPRLHSQNPSTGTSLPSTRYTSVLQPTPSTHKIRSNEDDASSEHSELGDADDEIEERMPTYGRKARHTTQRQPLTRSHLCNVQKCELVTDIPQQPLGTNIDRQARPRLQGLRSLSTTFLSGLKFEGAENAQQPPICRQTTPAFSKPQSMNPLRRIRGGKGSALLSSADCSFPASSTERIIAPNVGSVTNAEPQEQRPFQPQKSTLKDFALFLSQDFKSTPTIRSPSESQSSDMLRGATTVWSRSGINGQKGLQKGAESFSMSETAFESDSRATSFRSEGSSSVKADDAPPAIPEILSIPKSSTMNTWRSAINDLDVELDEQNTRETSNSTPMCHSTVAHCRIGDFAELSQSAMPNVQMHGERAQNPDHVPNLGERGLYPPRSTSLKALARAAHGRQLR